MGTNDFGGWLARQLVTHGYRSQRAFARLLADAEARALDTIVVSAMDRWSRSLRVTLETLQRLDRAGVALVSLREHIDYGSAVGKLTISMMGAIAQFQSDDRAASARRIHADLRGQGKHPSGRPPYGAIVGPDGRLAVNPALAATLARILDAAARDSDYRIAEALNAEAVPPPMAARQRGASSPGWWPRAVRAVVRRGDWLLAQPEPWPARYLAAANRPRLHPTAPARTTYALTGLLRCARCGGPVTHQASPTRPLACHCQHPGCRAYHGPAAPHTAAVLAAASGLALRPPPAISPGVDASAWRTIAEDRRRAGVLYQRGVYDDDQLTAALAEIDARAAALTAASGPTRDLAAVARALPHLAGMEAADQNAILRELIDRVVLDRADRRIIWRAETLALFAGV